MSTTTGFDLRTVQPVASRYAEYAIPSYPIQWVQRVKQWGNEADSSLPAVPRLRMRGAIPPPLHYFHDMVLN